MSASAGKCSYCGDAGAKSRCTRCKTVFYCGRKCQVAHWRSHKQSCGVPLEDEMARLALAFEPGDRVVVVGGDHDGRPGGVIRTSGQDLRGKLGATWEDPKVREPLILLVEDLLGGKVAPVRL